MDFAFCGNRLAIGLAIGADARPVEEYRDFDGRLVRIFDIAGDAAGGEPLLTLRELYGRIPDSERHAAMRASQILHWRRTYRFCPQCGAPLSRKTTGEMAMRCEVCRRDFFPRIDPAVIVAIDFNGSLLLAERTGDGGRRFYSLIAGFVEPGESLEEAVRREVREEVGLELASLEYARSQPWPFPSQLMIGFRATAASGDIHPDGEEVRRAGWFPPDALPENLPQPISIARKLIEEWLTAKS